ncbi:MAG: hypothetical protein HOV68_02630 [Streptomycetaceae bacterium]|nr:hypothetical protein [Streptomycetaceae bacterium]
MVLGLVALVLPATACSDGSGPDDAGATNDIAKVIGGQTAQPSASPKPSTLRPDPSTDAAKPPLGEQARGLVRAVALTPQDWGPTYQRQEGYESEELTRYTLGADCKAFEDGTMPGAEAAMYRYAFMPTASGLEQVFAVSGATAYRDEATAKKEMQQVRDDAARCPAQTLTGGERLTSVVTGPMDVPGADESLAMEATWVDDKGDKNGPYVWVMARRGTVVLAALAVDLKAPDISGTEDLAHDGVTKMVERLEAELKQS